MSEPAQPPLPPGLTVLDRDDVAAILKVHPSSVSKMASSGRLPSFRTGPGDGQLRFTLTDLEEYIRRQREKHGTVVRRLPANHHARRRRLHAVDTPAPEPWDAA